MQFLFLNNGTRQNSGTFKVFSSYRENVKHAISNQICIIMMGLFSLSVFGEEVLYYNESAVEVCKGLEQTSISGFGPSTAELRMGCLRKIAGKQFNESAVEICKGLEQASNSSFAPSTAKLRMECLERIAGKQFNESAVEICKELEQTSNSSFAPSTAQLKMACLDTVANGQSYEEVQKHENCKGFACDPPGYEQADKDCEGFACGPSRLRTS